MDLVLNILECHFNWLAPAVLEVLTQYGPREPLEQLDWSEIQADLTWGLVLKVVFS